MPPARKKSSVRGKAKPSKPASTGKERITRGKAKKIADSKLDDSIVEESDAPIEDIDFTPNDTINDNVQIENSIGKSDSNVGETDEEPSLDEAREIETMKNSNKGTRSSSRIVVSPAKSTRSSKKLVSSPKNAAENLLCVPDTLIKSKKDLSLNVSSPVEEIKDIKNASIDETEISKSSVPSSPINDDENSCKTINNPLNDTKNLKSLPIIHDNLKNTTKDPCEITPESKNLHLSENSSKLLVSNSDNNNLNSDEPVNLTSTMEIIGTKVSITDRIRHTQKTADKSLIIKYSGELDSKNRKFAPIMFDEHEESKPKILPPSVNIVKPKNSPSRYIVIRNLTRPFTIRNLKDRLSSIDGCQFLEESFWINDIKSFCIAEFYDVQQAELAITDLNGVKWPEFNPKYLVVDYAKEYTMFKVTNGTLGQKIPDDKSPNTSDEEDLDSLLNPKLPIIKSNPQNYNNRLGLNGDNDLLYNQNTSGFMRLPRAVDIDKLFNKTKTKPFVYWLPAKSVINSSFSDKTLSPISNRKRLHISTSESV